VNSTTLTEKAVHFSLDAHNGVPIYRQIIQQIEYAILSGRMHTGDRLPTIRQLAVDLKINPNTIAKAYSELEIRGIVETQVGSGTYISDKKPPDNDDKNKKIRELVLHFTQEMASMGVSKKTIIDLLQSEEDS
jgi:GntR family transcriptional regulator